MLGISKNTFERWNREGVVYCHWKSNEHLLEGLDGITDLDVLVDQADKDKVTTTLSELRYLSCKSQYGSRYPNVQDWIGFDECTGSLIHLHLHYELVTGHKGLKEYNLPWREEVLKTRVLNSEYQVYTSHPDIEIVTLYSRIGLKASLPKVYKAKTNQFKLDGDVKKEIHYLKERCQWENVSRIIEAYYGQYAKEMLGIVRAECLDSKSFLRLKYITEKVMQPYSRYKFLCFRKLYALLSINLLLQLRYKFGLNRIVKKVPAEGRGVTIAFLGQDGAGKSTVTKEIKKWLSWKLDTRLYYMGSGDGYFSWQRRVLTIMPHWKLIRPIKGLLHISDTCHLASNKLDNIQSAEKFKSQGGIVIYDRFPQCDYSAINDGPYIRTYWMSKLPRLFRPILTLMADIEEGKIKRTCENPPEVMIKLMLSVEESMRRKPEENMEMVKRKHEIIEKIHYKGTKEYIIDATQPYDEEIVKIKKIIWEHIPKL